MLCQAVASGRTLPTRYGTVSLRRIKALRRFYTIARQQQQQQQQTRCISPNTTNTTGTRPLRQFATLAAAVEDDFLLERHPRSTFPLAASSSLSPPLLVRNLRHTIINNQDCVDDLVRDYANRPQTSASLQMLMRSGQGEFVEPGAQSPVGQLLATQRVLLQLACFLRQELPIRLARRITDLDNVPLMRDMPSVRAVKQVYIDSFLAMIAVEPIQTAGDEEQFAELLEVLYNKHSGVLVEMARGAYELRELVNTAPVTNHSTPISPRQEALEFARLLECHNFLDRFYISRIGIRVLAGQYLALRHQHAQQAVGVSAAGYTNNNNNNNNSSKHKFDSHEHDYIGMICRKTSPFMVVRQAAEDAKSMCRREYGRAPQVVIAGQTDLTFPYVPTYLHYICLELLKNALRATCDSHARELPPVTVIIADGDHNEDVVIKIADEGGGIPRSQVDKIWSYLYTTADPSVQKAFLNGNDDHCHTSPLAGLGYGLPISRSYCEYFGGALDLVSMEGYGTDAFIHLKRLGDSEEPLPV